MTTVSGTIRSTETRTADGHGDDQSTARNRAIEGAVADGFELVETKTLASKSGDVTVQATARSTNTAPHEATGPNYAAALAAYRQSIPDGWMSLHVTARD